MRAEVDFEDGAHLETVVDGLAAVAERVVEMRGCCALSQESEGSGGGGGRAAVVKRG